MIQSRVKRLGVVVVSASVLFVLLAALEPGYKDICTQAQHAAQEDCPRYDVVYVALWHIGQALDRASPAITALATAAIGGFTWTLWRATTDQGRLTREAIDEAKKSSERQLRAYISIIEAHRKTDHGTAMTFRVVIKNTGQTPAYKTTLDMAGKFGPCSEDVIPDFPVDTQPTLSVGPGEPITGFYKIDPPLSGASLAAIEAGSHAYFLRCRAKYVDAFEKDRTIDVILAYAKGNMENGHLGACSHGHTDT